MSKPKPCRCERLSFPHRRDHLCDEYEDALPVGYDGGNLGCADEDEYRADCRARARDMNLAARGR
jgi:hypothetical protein